MPNPTQPFLVLVTVTNSSGTAEPAAEVKFSSASETSQVQYTDSLGRIIFDIADIDYTSGETITVTTNDRFDNDISIDTFGVSGVMYELDITLSQRTKFSGGTVGYKITSILHNIGDKPVTKDNPLPVESRYDLLLRYALSGADDDKMIYGYIDKDGGWYIQKYNSNDKTYKYIRGASGFSSNWNNRSNLTYSFFNEVF